jgi:hypothetical protein
VGLGAKLGGKDFMRGLGSGLQDLGPNMARARQEKEKRAHELAKLAPGEERDQASFEQELADSQAEALSQMGSKGLARQRDALIGQYGENVVDRAFNMAEEREAKAGREERQTAADELRAGASVTGAETGKLTAENRQEHLRQQREKAERDAGKPTFKVVSGELVKIDPDGTTETVKKKLISRTDAADMLMVYEEFIKEPLTERDGQDLLYPEDEDRQTESDYRRALLASEIARMREIVGAQDVPDEEAAHRKKLEDSEWIFNQGP